MALLKRKEYFSYTLKCLNKFTEPVHKSLIVDAVAKSMSITEEDKNIMLANKNYPDYKYRIDWSLAYLKQAELIEIVNRGIYKITDFGRKFLEENSNFDFNTMKEKTPYLQNEKSRSKSILGGDDSSNEENSESDDIKLSTDEYYESIQAEILSRLKSLGSKNTVDKGTQFENICLDLLEKMGYGEKDRTGGSHDRGIDGTLTLDKFGFDKVGIQCKCYSSGDITDNEITKFYHGLKNVNGISRGIFITTTDFTPTAKKVVDETKDIKIVLINGPKLARLMREYKACVEVMETNYIYRIII